jgi:tetratricopeptide (TPR) repeat protein
VFVARDALDRAERDVDSGLGVAAVESHEAAPFSVVALHWLKALLCLARGAEDEALASFDRELALEARGHLYAREATANTWYAKGACHLGQGQREAARAAFREAVSRVPRHPMAHAGLAIVDDHPVAAATDLAASGPVELTVAHAARLVWAGDLSGAVPIVTAALGAAPPGNGGWLLPIEPLLGVRHARDAWAPALAALHLRARWDSADPFGAARRWRDRPSAHQPGRGLQWSPGRPLATSQRSTAALRAEGLESIERHPCQPRR